MSRAFITVFGIADEQGLIDGEPVSMIKTAVAAVRKGYAVVPLRPGTKVPDVCTLTARELKEAGPKHACGVAHYITEDVIARRVFERVQRTYDAPLNIGVVAGPSGLINVDADTAEAVRAFQNDWATAEDDPGYLAHSPTVLTPGAYRDNEWKHADGGHFYFEVPAGFDWTDYQNTVLKAPGGYDVRWGLQMSVVPPSTRKEGPYRPLGDVLPAPQFLIDMIEDSRRKAIERMNRRAELYANDSIATWSAKVTWEELLTFDGWTNTSKVDNCGCPIFEKPGGGSTSYKSATGHEGTCEDGHYENIEGHGPLHLWTTDPPAPLDWYVEQVGQTITKLRYVALTRFDDDVARAKMGLGIDEEPNLDDWLGKTTVTDMTPVTDTASHSSHDDETEDVTIVTDVTEPPSQPSHDDRDDVTVTATDRGVTAVTSPESVDPSTFVAAAVSKFGHPESRLPLVKAAFAKGLDERVAREAVDEYVRAISGGSVESIIDAIDAFAGEEFDTDEIAVPTVLARTDDQCIFHKGRVNYIVGRRGSAKTWLAMHSLQQVLEDGGSGIYFDFEDNRKLFYERAAVMGMDLETPRREKRFVYVRDFPTNVIDMPAFVERVGRFDLAVFDVINRMISRLGGNPDIGNEQVIWLTDNLFDPVAAYNTAVVVLDHPNKAGQRSDSTVEDLNPGGGAMKMNNASGVAIGLKPVKPFTRSDPAGHVRVFALKDRTGYFAENDPVGEFRGEMDLNAGGIGLGLRVDAPDTSLDVDRGIQGDVDDCKVKILAVLHVTGSIRKGALNSKVTQRLRPWIDVAIEQLAADGTVIVDGGTVSPS